MSSLGDGCITKGYRYANFSLTVLYLVVFLILITQNRFVFFLFYINVNTHWPVIFHNVVW